MTSVQAAHEIAHILRAEPLFTPVVEMLAVVGVLDKFRAEAAQGVSTVLDEPVWPHPARWDRRQHV